MSSRTALSFATLLTMTTPMSALGRQATPAASPSAGPQAAVARGIIEWVDRAPVAAKIEGIAEEIEKTIGMEAKQGEEIAFLDATMAELAFEKAKMIAEDESDLKMAEAEYEVARANAGRAQELKDYDSKANFDLAMAQFAVADARVKQAQAKLRQAKQDMELAKEAVEEHTIVAPFDGEILEVLKHPGEAVQAMEPVVVMARTDRLRFFGYVDAAVSPRLRKGMVVDVTPMSNDSQGPAPGAKRYRGKLVFISPEIATAQGRSMVQIKADIANNRTKDLLVGSRAQITVYLTDDPAQIPADPEDSLPLPEAPDRSVPALARDGAAPSGASQ